MPDENRLKKLRWLCRRGMKELDVLLEQFIERYEDRLIANEWPELEALLEQEDDVLWDWIQDPAHDAASDFRVLLRKIRHDASTAH